MLPDTIFQIRTQIPGKSERDMRIRVKLLGMLENQQLGEGDLIELGVFSG